MNPNTVDKTYLMILNSIKERRKPLNLAQIVISIAQKQNFPLDRIEELYDQLNKSIQESLEIGLLCSTGDGCYISSEMQAEQPHGTSRKSQSSNTLNSQLSIRRTRLTGRAKPAAQKHVQPQLEMYGMHQNTCRDGRVPHRKAAIKALERIKVGGKRRTKRKSFKKRGRK